MKDNTKRYTFQTIVSPAAVREDFTTLRNQLNSSDKELMQAFWNLGIDRLDDIKREVEMLQASNAKARNEKKELKIAAKRKEKELRDSLKKEKTPAAPKKKATKKKEQVSVVTVVDEDDQEPPTLVVDGCGS
jgi:peptidoglycan hydrolase CwlO-like protein